MKPLKKRQLVKILLILSLSLILCAGCAVETTQDNSGSESTSDILVPGEVLAAREAVLEFVREGAILAAPPENMAWQSSLGGEEVPDGFAVYYFTAEECVVTITFPEPAGEDTAYHVSMFNEAVGFCWQALVDSKGHITKTGNAAGLEPGPDNPASIYCEAQGYSYQIVTHDDGTECGACVFTDGSLCNGWEFFRGECAPGDNMAEGG